MRARLIRLGAFSVFGISQVPGCHQEPERETFSAGSSAALSGILIRPANQIESRPKEKPITLFVFFFISKTKTNSSPSNK